MKVWIELYPISLQYFGFDAAATKYQHIVQLFNGVKLVNDHDCEVNHQLVKYSVSILVVLTITLLTIAAFDIVNEDSIANDVIGLHLEKSRIKDCDECVTVDIPLFSDHYNKVAFHCEVELA